MLTKRIHKSVRHGLLATEPQSPTHLATSTDGTVGNERGAIADSTEPTGNHVRGGEGCRGAADGALIVKRGENIFMIFIALSCVAFLF